MRKILPFTLTVCIVFSLVIGLSPIGAADDSTYSKAVLAYVEANTEYRTPEIGAYWTPYGDAVKTPDGSAYDEEAYKEIIQKYVDAGLTYAVTGNETYSMLQLDTAVRNGAEKGLGIWLNINLYKEATFNDVWYKFFIVAYLGYDYYAQPWNYLDITEDEWDELRSAQKRAYYDQIWDENRDKINHDALAAVYIVDEPDLNTAGADELYREFTQLEAKMDAYGITTPVGINFLPMQATGFSNNNSAYNMYLDAYLLNADEVFSGYKATRNTKINVDWLMYDFYTSQGNASSLYVTPYFVNQFYFMNYAQKLGVPVYDFVNIVRQNRGGSLYSPTRTQLLLDVNLRYMLGAEGVCYFLGWPAFNSDEWSFCMFNPDGSTTTSYDNVKYVNERIDAMKGVYLAFENKDGVIEVNGSDVKASLNLGSNAAVYNGPDKGDVLKYNKTSTAALSSATGSHAYIGLFTKEGSTDEGFYLVNANYNTAAATNVLNFSSSKYYQVWGAEGLEKAGKASSLTVTTAPADAKFIIVSDTEDARITVYNNAVSVYDEAAAKYESLDKNAYKASSLEAYKALIDALKADIDANAAPEILAEAAKAAAEFELKPYDPSKMIGDINEDGEVNGIDAGLLLQIIANWDLDSINLENADINQDGIIDGIDSGILLQYLAGWDVEF